MRRTYTVTLTTEQRHRLEKLVRSGVAPARMISHAHILLKADEGEQGACKQGSGPALSVRAIAQALDLCYGTVHRVRRRFCEEGLEAALERAPTKRVYERALDGRAEAHLVALACSEPPQGRARWTVRLLADKMVELAYVEHVSRESVRRTLKKTSLSPT